MRQFPKVFTCTILLSSLLIFISCKKEGTNTPPPAVNNTLTAYAGADQTISLPTDSVQLNGSGTGIITSYKWSQMSGANQPINSAPSTANTKIKGLVLGSYEFRLKVTDASGDSAVDYVVINVVPPEVLNGLVRVGQLSIKRSNVAAVAAGNKIFFAGGILPITSQTLSPSSRVDIYDIITKKWSTAELSEPRSDIGAVAVGNKVLFASGINKFTDDYWADVQFSTRVDIYDIITNKWTTTEIPGTGESFRDGFYATAAAAGNKAIFCDGLFGDVYDVINNSWISYTLSTSRDNFASSSLGNKIFIAGNGTKNIDVFDVSTNLWTIQSLSESRGMIRAASLNNKVFFAGGEINENLSDKVDIYDNNTETWSVAHLSRAAALAGAVSSGNRMFFFGGTVVDIYDTSANAWSVFQLDAPLDGAVFISAGGSAYATDGNLVWQIQL
ncbi:MAG: hypothetical protein ABI091_22015 [Ferruginibacter sp.]